MKKRGKKAVAIDSLIWWIIAISVLVIILITSIIFKDKLMSIGDYLKDLFRFKR
jgi:hypothetical protein